MPVNIYYVCTDRSRAKTHNYVLIKKRRNFNFPWLFYKTFNLEPQSQNHLTLVRESQHIRKEEKAFVLEKWRIVNGSSPAVL